MLRGGDDVEGDDGNFDVDGGARFGRLLLLLGLRRRLLLRRGSGRLLRDPRRLRVHEMPPSGEEQQGGGESEEDGGENSLHGEIPSIVITRMPQWAVRRQITSVSLDASERH